jgi:hypothetical protein
MTAKLRCPKCKANVFYVYREDGTKAYFHVGEDHKPFPLYGHEADELSGLDFKKIHCKTCSWVGSPQSLLPPAGGTISR